MGESAIADSLRHARLVAILTIRNPERAVPLARALLEGGLDIAEVTLRTPTALESIRRIAAEVPEIQLGAGTVLTPEQLRAAKGAGARFIVTPGFNARVVDTSRAEGLPIFPGVATPSEIEAALERDVRILKLFPMEAMGGVRYLQAISAPYAGTGVSFIPTGGIDSDNLSTYLRLPSVVGCAGSWVAPPEWIEAADFDRIREETRRSVELVREVSTSP